MRLNATPQANAAVAVFVDSNHAAISSALNNLISNSVRYTPRGGSISVGLEVGAEQVTVVVHDTGYGIPEAVTTALLEANMGASAQGAGIGLYVANQTLKRLANGVLLLRSSSVATGTVWVIALARSAAVTEEELQQQAGPSQKRQKTSFTLGAGQSIKADLASVFPGGVILVDDDEMARRATEGAMASRYNVPVQGHASAQEFLDRTFPAGAVGHPSRRCLILIDHLMPVADGEMVLDHIPCGHHHCLAMMSGSRFSDQDRQRIHASGIQMCFEKPLDWELFDDFLREQGRTVLNGERGDCNDL